MVMAQLGLEIKDNFGIMKGWRNVFINDIQADRSYIACAIIWVAGITVILLFTLVRQPHIWKNIPVWRSGQPCGFWNTFYEDVSSSGNACK